MNKERGWGGINVTVVIIVLTVLATFVRYDTPSYAKPYSMAQQSGISGPEIIARAKSWVDVNPQIPYNERGYYQGYREDCSGFASMAWQLIVDQQPASLTTYTLPSVSHTINKDDLQPGDIMLNQWGGWGAGNYGSPDAHVVIFDSWVDSSHTHYNAYEESPYYGEAHYTVNLPYPYWPGYNPDYIPMRLNSLSNSPAPTRVPNAGVTWTARTSGTQNDLYSVAWSGSQFVAVGLNTTILTSPDGITWTDHSIGDAGYTLLGVTWAGSQFVAVGYGLRNTDAILFTSQDGITWTDRSPVTAGHTLWGVTGSGSQFVAVGGNVGQGEGGSTIVTSSSGESWTTQNPGTQNELNSVSWSGSQFVAVGFYGTILTSPDGITWTTQNPGTQNVVFNSVSWSGSQFVAVGAGRNGSTIITSPDGSTWTAQTSGIPNDLFGVLYGVTWSGSQFVAVGAGENSSTILTSPDGSTWTAQTSGTQKDLRSVTWSGSRFVAVGLGGTILTSP